MSENLPAPLVGADVDLRGLEWMPLFGDRLFGSVTWITAPSDEVRVASLRLWWRGFAKELPAGSLPDDDKLLAEYAGYGVSVKAWLRIKPTAMRGWFQCSDGRLYHQVVAEVTLAAWDERVKYRNARETDRARLKRWRAEKKRKANGVSEPLRNGTDTRFDRSKTGQDRTTPLPPSGGGVVVERFLELRRDLWPYEDDSRIVLLTLRAQADQYIADGASPELVCEVIERAMRSSALARKSAPMNLRYFHRSVADAIAGGRPVASGHEPPPKPTAFIWTNRLRIWFATPDAPWLTTWRIDECPAEALTPFLDQLKHKPPPGYDPRGYHPRQERQE